MIKLGILLCDDHRPELVEKYGTYDQDFIQMLDAVAPGHFEYQAWRCHEEQFPNAADQVDVWIISGSKWGAYDPAPWIKHLKKFIQKIDQYQIPLLGICFGHQVIHSALGGHVAKSEKGWGLGAYPVIARKSFGAFSEGETIRVLSMHQDQVMKPAPGFDSLAHSEFCPHPITHKSQHILTFQSHPEFVDELFADLCHKIREKVDQELIESTLLKMGQEDDRHPVRRLVAEFLLGNSRLKDPLAE
ncbi:type 1 glutamine amidotransferase [Hahella ganghwensis]|uniref:type 1 glutamine amidotransferase n=1 Tax=Hahella ganghwensis TaxID=286420 RepID=UPI00037A012E|nr:type 1 glutamine amidotransferase [Hahella ganghwensis]